MTNKLTRIIGPDQRIVNASLTSHNPYDAVYNVNPELGAMMYAGKNDLITRENMPILLGFRALQSRERIALVNGMVRQYESDNETKADMHSWDRRYDIEDTRQSNMTTRERIKSNANVKMMQMHQNGETQRQGIRSNADITINEKQVDGQMFNEYTRQKGETQRTQIQAESLKCVERLKYETFERASQDRNQLERHISDNELKGAEIEADARYKLITTQEQIRADMIRGVSKDRLEERLSIAATESAEQLKLAEIERGNFRDEQKAEIALKYIETQTGLIIAQYELDKTFCLAQIDLEKLTRELDSKDYENMQLTYRQVLDIMDHGVKNGEKQILIEGQVGKQYFWVGYDSNKTVKAVKSKTRKKSAQRKKKRLN